MSELSAPGEAVVAPPPPLRRRSLWRRLPTVRLNWELAFYLVLVVVALGMRLWELDGRAIHFDEFCHVWYSYNYAEGHGYSHFAICHGPFKFHVMAFSFKLFGDSDFTARVPFALFSSAMVLLPYFLRRHLGRWGAMFVAAMLAFSPSMLYLGRFARDDILMVFWTLALVVLAWRYMDERRTVYLYVASAVLAFAFTSMESAFIVTGLLGFMLFLLGLPQIAQWAAGRMKMSQLAGPAGLLVLMITLTLPQWMPMVGLVQDYLGVVLVNMDQGKGPYGIPQGYGYIVAFGLVIFALALSIYAGVSWRGKTWLACAAIYYVIWITLYSSVFTNWGSGWWSVLSDPTKAPDPGQVQPGGIATGFWESLGYWIAQQGVARGGQPWYLYLAMGSVYEFIPLLFSLPAFFYYLRLGDSFGLFLSLWAFITFGAFVYAGEKMPWLTVQVVLPFILLTGKFLGDLVHEVRWRRVVEGGRVLLLPATAATLGLGVWLMYRFVDRGRLDAPSWALLGVVGVLCLAWTGLMYRARHWGAAPIAVLGVAALLFGFGVFVAGRASYSYNDPLEMLAYAQTSVDVRKVSQEVRDLVAQARPGGEIAVDYELWYPYGWYARHDANVHFKCYKSQSEEGWQPYCSPLKEKPSAAAVLMVTSHANRDEQYLTDYQKRGAYWNWLWFPQVYKVPSINPNDGFIERRWKEISYLKDHIDERAAWRGFWRYVLTRKMGSQWWFSDFYVFVPR